MKKGTFIYSVAKQKCPRCHEGDLFVSNNWYSLKNIGKLPDECPVCKQDFKMEDGFFLGATYVSYALTVAITIPLLALAYYLFDLDFMQMLPVLIGIVLIVIPPVIRLSRSIWFNFFVQYEPNALTHEREQTVSVP